MDSNIDIPPPKGCFYEETTNSIELPYNSCPSRQDLQNLYEHMKSNKLLELEKRWEYSEETNNENDFDDDFEYCESSEFEIVHYQNGHSNSESIAGNINCKSVEAIEIDNDNESKDDSFYHATYSDDGNFHNNDGVTNVTSTLEMKRKNFDLDENNIKRFKINESN